MQDLKAFFRLSLLMARKSVLVSLGHMHQQPELAPFSGPNRSSTSAQRAGVSGRTTNFDAVSLTALPMDLIHNPFRQIYPLAAIACLRLGRMPYNWAVKSFKLALLKYQPVDFIYFLVLVPVGTRPANRLARHNRGAHEKDRGHHQAVQARRSERGSAGSGTARHHGH